MQRRKIVCQFDTSSLFYSHPVLFSVFLVDNLIIIVLCLWQKWGIVFLPRFPSKFEIYQEQQMLLPYMAFYGLKG